MESFKNLAEAEIFHRQKEKKNDGVISMIEVLIKNIFFKKQFT